MAFSSVTQQLYLINFHHPFISFYLPCQRENINFFNNNNSKINYIKASSSLTRQLHFRNSHHLFIFFYLLCQRSLQKNNNNTNDSKINYLMASSSLTQQLHRNVQKMYGLAKQCFSYSTITSYYHLFLEEELQQ